MPSAVLPPKKNFRSVLAFTAAPFNHSPTPTTRSSIHTFHHQPRPTPRASVDVPRSYTNKPKNRAERSTVTDISFFDSDTPSPHNDLSFDFNMKNIDANHSRPVRRAPVRIDAQEGPWSVSVAETPHDPRSSYSIYIKTPTHNLTLTRTATEIVELNDKLRDSYPGTKLPKLPIDVAALPAPPIKRKSTFLNTLSRLASPSTNKVSRQVSKSQPHSNHSSGLSSVQPTPVVSPSQEIGDPFSSLLGTKETPLSNGHSANSPITALAAYLTTVSNESSVRQSRAWKRFVRVRTDDLESVRVERAIKRVRSDLAAHVSPKVPEMSAQSASASVSVSANVSSANISELEGVDEPEVHLVDGDIGNVSPSDLRGEEIKEEEEGEGEQKDLDIATLAGETGHENGVESKPPPTGDGGPTIAEEEPSPLSAPIDTSAANGIEDDEITTLPTPVALDSPASRIPRSQSADPDKAHRLSRVYTTSTLDGASSQTGDESSISTTAGRRSARKKRSQSSDPNKESKKKSQRKVVVDDFEMMRVLGKGCAGKVLLVRHKLSSDLYALKAITKRHVLAHQELQHTLTEQAVLKRMAAESKDPFVVKLWWSFHDKENLFLVMDFHPGGDLATQLARWGRLGRDRARFYAAEIVEGVEGLHAAGVIYRDLKPENILIGADGHIVLTDFGLSKEFPRRATAATAPSTPSGSRGEFYSSSPGTAEPATPPWMRGERGQELAMGWPGQPVGQADTTSTFCGTAEYLAPEVIQGLPYSYEVDWWSFGTMLYEMLTGITPFWANNHSDMYVRVLQDELQFPDDRAVDQDTKSLIRGLLQRNPALRMCEPRIKRHPYFSMIDWSHVYYKRYIPPYIPPIDPSNASDTQNFDDTFLDMEPVIDDPNENEQTDTDQDRDQTDMERTDGEDSNTTPSHSRSPSVHPDEDSVDVFDGYSFKGRHSIIIGEDEGSEESEGEESDEEGLPAILADILVTQPGQEETLDGAVDALTIDERTPEPKTPEARPHTLPAEEPIANLPVTPVEEPPAPIVAPKPPVEQVATTPRTSKEVPKAPVSPPKELAPTPPVKDIKPKLVKAPAARTGHYRTARGKREKSGVAALDRFLSDGPDEDGNVTEKDDEDDDWDFIEAVDGEDRNGTKGTSLFARGVVDRYRLAVFRKASTPSQRPPLRTFSSMSKESEVNGAEPTDSPSPSDKQRRGRTPGLNFRKHPRQFLRAKSPPSAKSGSTAKTLSHSTSATLSSASSTGMMTPSLSGASTLPISPSLKSKESATSVGESVSSDQSNGEAGADLVHSETRTPAVSHVEEPEKLKNKKLKKYKENAEKVFSLFASPRQAS
ncbi:hypothetical protein SERLA73DRAFT_163458 [Serpula lacrymans var. lacrymans S7.3]|uniref:non-specific serine/threonine protein kinase n=2 Tax=Serpula lacrymans var. lacrymans TaxID=341189 RepID=F8QDP6_SERL3|nr:uncharacterized protein SERLADRAFT_418688 [Serpula lacrymans var. lacrymans S7.9]EGN93717.1 hypothetical protein SERLA73DRAFT_163458 [Serpula lacrymans var. lacrymans S7.3]EGO19088.1 hypothetical protein SERLADRAFT_418688 [Serpula lacrymans var. lacrymans S7.9]